MNMNYLLARKKTKTFIVARLYKSCPQAPTIDSDIVDTLQPV
jgi:hypothetical protein